MPEEFGVYDETARSCAHAERRTLTTCILCPACDSFVMTQGPGQVYRELTEELVNAQHFESADGYYLAALEDAHAKVRKLINP